MEIKIKIKRPGKGCVVMNFSCSEAETLHLLKLEKQTQRLISKKEKKNKKDM